MTTPAPCVRPTRRAETKASAAHSSRFTLKRAARSARRVAPIGADPRGADPHDGCAVGQVAREGRVHVRSAGARARRSGDDDRPVAVRRQPLGELRRALRPRAAGRREVVRDHEGRDGGHGALPSRGAARPRVAQWQTRRRRLRRRRHLTAHRLCRDERSSWSSFAASG